MYFIRKIKKTKKETAKASYIVSLPYTSSQLSAAVNDKIYGYMQYQGGTTWLIEAQDITSSSSTGETLATNNSFYNPVVVLESYNIPHQCSYLSGNTDFTGLSLTGSSNTNWSTANPIQWCHINAVKVSSSEIDLHTQS